MPEVGKQIAPFSPDFTQPGKSLLEVPCTHHALYKVFMRKVMRHYAIKYDVELLLHILVNIFHLGTLFSTVSRAKV